MYKNEFNQDVRSVNDCVDQVYVLSVRTFTQRIHHITTELTKHAIDFRFVFEHDATDLDERITNAVFSPGALANGQRSLILKNIHVWRDAVAKGYRHVLVFEDDAVLASTFRKVFDQAMAAAEKQTPGWMIFLGGFDTRVPLEYFRSRGPLVELPMATAEACVYDQETMQRRLAWLSRNPVSLPADHLMRHIDQQEGTRQYWLRHPIVEQGSVVGLFGTVLDSSRSKHSLLYHRIRNYWNKIHRRYFWEWVIRVQSLITRDKRDGDL